MASPRRTTLSDSDFHQVIVKKYQFGKSRLMSCTSMIFYKNPARFLLQKSFLDILIQLKFHFHKSYEGFSSFVTKLNAAERVFSSFKSNRTFLKSMTFGSLTKTRLAGTHLMLPRVRSMSNFLVNGYS